MKIGDSSLEWRHEGKPIDQEGSEETKYNVISDEEFSSRVAAKLAHLLPVRAKEKAGGSPESLL